MTVANNIARIRAERGLSQRALASMAGVNHVQLAKIESGITHTPSTSTLLRLRDALGVSLDEFYRTLETQTPPTNEQPEPNPENHG